jgi:hypothetical protein
MGEPEQPEPWCKLDPEDALDPWDEFAEPEPPGIPIVIGPAPRHKVPAPKPMTVQGPGVPPENSILSSGVSALFRRVAVPGLEPGTRGL